MTFPRDELFRALMSASAVDQFRSERARSAAFPFEGPPLSLRAAEDSGLGTIFGHFSVFDEWTEINSWEGNFLERIAVGAFRKTFKERGARVRCLFDHGYDVVVGDKPLGPIVVLREDEAGAYGEVRLSDTSYNRDLSALIRDGAIDGQSFRFSVTREEWVAEPKPSSYNPLGLPERTIREVRLFEFGPVTFPAYEATTLGIRSREGYKLWLEAGRPRPTTDTGTPSDAADPGTSESAPPARGTRSSKAVATAALLRMGSSL